MPQFTWLGLIGRQNLCNLSIYMGGKCELSEVLPTLSYEQMVDDMLEPLSNKQRIHVMKALSSEIKSLSALSSLSISLSLEKPTQRLVWGLS
jgi:hypothetical protein